MNSEKNTTQKQINKPIYLIFLFVGSIPLIFSLILFFNSGILYLFGSSTTGKIIEKSIVYDKKGSKNNIYVLFTDKKNIRHLILSSISKDEFDNYNHREDLEVIYLPFYPKFNGIKKEVNFFPPFILLFISLIYFFTGKYIIWSINPTTKRKDEDSQSTREA